MGPHPIPWGDGNYAVDVWVGAENFERKVGGGCLDVDIFRIRTLPSGR
jgi:hypothetical protein